jgi:hypothetical protein
MVSGCTFRASRHGQGSMTLAYVAGSSADFVEQRQLNLLVSWSAIRGLSVAQPVGDSRTQSQDEILIDVRQSLLSDTWLSRNLRGAIRVTDGSLVHSLTSLGSSPTYKDRFRIEIDKDCAAAAVYTPNPDLDLDITEAATEPARGWESALRDIGFKTDYRARPAETEFQRQESAGLGQDES